MDIGNVPDLFSPLVNPPQMRYAGMVSRT